MIRKSSLGLIVLFILGTLIFAGCPASPNTIVAAKVNGKPIFLSQVTQEPEFQRAVLGAVFEELVNQEAKKKRITVDPAKVEKEMQLIIDQYGGKERFELAMQQNALSFDVFRKKFFGNELFKELVRQEIKVTEEDAKAAFEKAPAAYRAWFGRKQGITDQTKIDTITFSDLKADLMDTLRDQQLEQKQTDLRQRLLDENEYSSILVKLPPKPKEQRVQLEKQMKEMEEQQRKEEARKKGEIEKEGEKKGPVGLTPSESAKGREGGKEGTAPADKDKKSEGGAKGTTTKPK